jgi:hypothetical protein
MQGTTSGIVCLSLRRHPCTIQYHEALDRRAKSTWRKADLWRKIKEACYVLYEKKTATVFALVFYYVTEPYI